MGTLHSASLNPMNGIGRYHILRSTGGISLWHLVELSLRDDLESLSYVGLFLVRADLPWGNGPKHEPMKCSIKRIRGLKAKWTGAELGAGYEPKFGYLLDYSRGLGFRWIPNYEMWRACFADLVLGSGVVSGESLDWTPEALPTTIPQITAPSEAFDVDDTLEEVEKRQPGFERIGPSYMGIDIDCWDFIQRERDLDLTMPLEYKGAMDYLIPKITEVYRSFWE